MSKVVNITDKLSKEKPVIQIGEKLYTVNDGMDTVLKFEELASTNTVENIQSALELALGKEAVAEIGTQTMSVSNFQVLIIAILAAMQGLDYDEAEKRFRKQAAQYLV